MRLPPNRLFYFLPLLLFGWTTPDLAAQTWTTVWTPGSAPAAKTVTSASTREYKTNCYPCKEWEDYGDGTGKWTDLSDVPPSDTCPSSQHARKTQSNAGPGQTTLSDHDNPCKVCTNGEVTNKANSTECDPGGGKSGKCCEGVCVEIPPAGIDPCAWAIGNNEFRKRFPKQFQPVTGPEGFIICIFGESYPCVPPDNIPQAWKWANIDSCVQRHEQYHKDHSPIQCPPCGTGIGTYANAGTERHEECCAFFDTLLCLKDLLNAGPNNQNKATIQKTLDDTTDKMMFDPLFCWGGIDSKGKQLTPVQMPCN